MKQARSYLFSATTTLLLISFLITACNSHSNRKVSQQQVKDLLIPPGCVDQTGKDVRITGLMGSMSYNAERHFYSPVKADNGLIKYDFNGDGAVDYIFLARQSGAKDALLVTCLSREQAGNTRYHYQKTMYSIREFKENSLYVEFAEIERKGNQLVIRSGNHAHNDGGFSETVVFEYNREKQDFSTLKYEYNAYGEAFPEIYQLFDFKQGIYREKKGCTFAYNIASMAYDPNCKPSDIQQCLSLPVNSTIRANVGKGAFEKLIHACE